MDGGVGAHGYIQGCFRLIKRLRYEMLWFRTAAFFVRSSAGTEQVAQSLSERFLQCRIERDGAVQERRADAFDRNGWRTYRVLVRHRLWMGRRGRDVPFLPPVLIECPSVRSPQCAPAVRFRHPLHADPDSRRAGGKSRSCACEKPVPRAREAPNLSVLP